MTEQMPLRRLSICPCGFGVLDDGIPVGTMYQVDRGSLRSGWTYFCGGCRRMRKIRVVDASSVLSSAAPLRPLPLELFMDSLYVYTIYRSPKDYPGKFVVRRHAIVAGGVHPEPDPDAVVTTLVRARKALPAGLYNMGRDPRDEPQIVESWI